MASTSWQLAEDSALRYHRVLVPSILGPAADAVVSRAPAVQPRRVVDLGCGTGAALSSVAPSAASTTELIGIDNNRAMLRVAIDASKGLGRRIRYCAGDLVALPFRDASCDLLLCAQTLQFVGDYAAAAAEMRRVLHRSGTALIGLWCPVEENRYFAALIAAIERHISARTAAGLKAIFNLSDADAAASILRDAGFDEISVAAVEVRAELGDLAAFIPRHIAATPMAAAFAEAHADVQAQVVEDVVREVGPSVGARHQRAMFTTWVLTARP